MPAARGHRTKKTPKDYSCHFDGCGKTFNRTYDLQRHQRIHCNYDDRRFGCPIEGCNFRANQLAGLKVHENSIHKGIRLPCDYPNCDRTFSDPSSRSKHRQRFHNQHDGDQVAEGSEPGPKLEEVPQPQIIQSRYSPEAAIPPVPNYFPLPPRTSTGHVSHGVTVPARVARHVEENSGYDANDVLSQFATFVLEASSSTASVPEASDNDSDDSGSYSSTSTSSRRSSRRVRHPETYLRGVSQGASVASSSAVPSSAASPAPSTSVSSLPTPTQIPSPASELLGVYNSQSNVPTNVHNAQRMHLDLQSAFESFAVPPANTSHDFNNMSLSSPPASTSIQHVSPFDHSPVQQTFNHYQHQFQQQQQQFQSSPSYQIQPSTSQEPAWQRSFGDYEVEARDFNIDTLSFGNEQQPLHREDFRDPDLASTAGVNATFINTEGATSNILPTFSTSGLDNQQRDEAFALFAVQSLNVQEAEQQTQSFDLTDNYPTSAPVSFGQCRTQAADALDFTNFTNFNWSAMQTSF